MFEFKILILTIILTFNFGCNSADNISLVKNESEILKIEEFENQKIGEKIIGEIPSDLLITMDKPQCQGFELCQIYKIAVKSDGSVLFEGLRNTKVKGKAKGKISEEKIKELIKEFEKANYFVLMDNYNIDTCPASMTDGSNVNTSIQINGRKKAVNHYLGCLYGVNDFENPLFKLTELENKIREISGAKRWIGEIK
jgi:hypothetical protein